MLQLLVLGQLIVRRFPGGKTLDAFEKSRLFIEDTAIGMRPPHIQREIQKAEEEQLWEVLLPAQISSKTFREEDACWRLQNSIGWSVEGEYVFTLREWRELEEWFAVVVHSMAQRKKRCERMNGRGRLVKGRRRWEDPIIQAIARNNAAMHTSVWLGHGMWQQ